MKVRVLAATDAATFTCVLGGAPRAKTRYEDPDFDGRPHHVGRRAQGGIAEFLPALGHDQR